MTSPRRVFPVKRFDRDVQLYPHCPDRVPWSAVEQCEGVAREHYGKTLHDLCRLDSSGRGGLDPIELCCLLDGRPFGLWGGSYQQAYRECVERLQRVCKTGRACR